MYQFSPACVQIERRVGEGALSESFFLIKDGNGEDCGLARAVCGVSSIPPCSPLRAGEPLSAFCFTSSAEFTPGSGPAPRCCIQCSTSCVERRCESPRTRALRTRERKHMTTCWFGLRYVWQRLLNRPSNNLINGPRSPDLQCVVVFSGPTDFNKLSLILYAFICWSAL